jgi:catechol 2,3-dioxygenase-like lactoylglutathione lyase family enzyme
MKPIFALIFAFAVASFSLHCEAQQQPTPDLKDLPMGSDHVSADQLVLHPNITGIALVRLRVTDMATARKFYADILGMPQGTQGCFSPQGTAVCFFINLDQQLELVPGAASDSGVETLGFRVGDAATMRKYLLARGVKCGEVTKSNSGEEVVEVRDPQNQRILFLSRKGGIAASWPPPLISNQLIHAGFVVHDRAATDRFYKDILGFRPYWHGGMKDDKDDWVAVQVPDGTDWLEYMLNISPNADHHTLGVMNHIALGVTDIHETQKQLIANGWRPTEEPKLGRDGKWQLNVYDPDDTRTEFMEFKPKEAPCCSAFTGPHPGPK